MTSSEQLVVENRQFATFDRLDEFESLLKSILSVNVAEDPTEEEEESEMNSTRKITLILDTFQEQSYLLDPFLERLVVPTMEAFKQHVMAFVRDPSRPGSSSRAVRLATILYWFSKNRGAKTVVRFFPHQIEDLTAVLTYLSTPTSYANKDENWQIRYCLLLWLSLVIMIPFDLSRFDPDDATKTGETFKALEEVGKNNLDRAGIDGEGAATLLAKLYSRRDASRGLEGFLNWADTRLTDKADPFMAIGVLHVLCDMTKTGGSLRAADLDHIQSLNNNLESKGRLSANTLVRKWRAKLTSRLALCSLPQKTATIARKQLMGNILSVPSQDDADLDAEIPDTIESTIETLLSALQDRDTTVRWSAAKGLARITERLPKDFCDQILESVMELFSIHLNDVSGVLADLQPVAEPTWHGASLACAEIARRGLVSESNLPILVGWLQKGLYFDVRKGAHSIGSNVRDATAYVLWAMARAHDIDSLRPFALDLARQLVAVAVFDREVHIRRAASAAFQENVGRTGLYPHGIDVVRKADFFTVGIRRNAFLVAAPQVAEHVEYRSLLTNHLLTITLKHWDPSMRQLGSTALAEIAKLNISEDGPTCAFRAATLLSSPDSDEVHGGLLALSELAKIYKESQILEAKRLEIFQYIISLPQSTFTRYRNELIVEAGCMAISNSISIEALHLPESDIKTPWRSIVDLGLKHRLPEVQYAAAHAMGVDFKTSTPVMQQSLSRLLGMLGYKTYPEGTINAIQCLLDAVNPKSDGYSSNVETRQNCYHSLSKILWELDSDISKHLNSQLINSIYTSYKNGLEDYTSDERGDVGSWIRAQCIRSFVASSTLLFKLFPNDTGKWVDVNTYQEIVAALLKQAAERLDHIRIVAGTELCKLVHGWKESGASENWDLKGIDIFRREFLDIPTVDQRWGEGTWLYPKIINMLEVEDYRTTLLTGIVLSIGSRNEGTTKPASNALTSYALSLPLSSTQSSSFTLIHFLRSISALAQKNITSNTLFVPILQTFHSLLDGGALSRLGEEEYEDKVQGEEMLKTILMFGGRNVEKLKSVPRINASMHLVIGFVALPSMKLEAIGLLLQFLGHKFPTIRSNAAEALYLVLQTVDFDVDPEIEEILLETEWSSELDNGMKERIEKLTTLLREAE